MKRLTCWLAAAGLALGVAGAAAAPAWADKKTGHTQEKKHEGKKHKRKVTLDELPAPVRETILKEARKNRITEIEQETANGKTLYEAEWKQKGRETGITVTPDGKIVAREVELALKDAPEPVRKTVLKEAGGRKVKEVEAETRSGRTVYEAEWHEGGKEVEIKVAPDGTVLEREAEEEDDHQDDDDDD